MIRTIALAIVAFSSMPLAAAAQCEGPGPTVTAVAVSGVSHTPYLTLYRVSATVKNLGTQAQAGDVLQFVDVMQYGGRLDDRGVPPLGPGQSYTVSYVWPRSSDAGKLTSPLDFHLRSASTSGTVCSARSGAGIVI